MNNSDIALRRLRNQGLSKIRFTDPKGVVAQLGAVQAQDYAGAKWALGQRMLDATDAALDQAFADGSILRTHLLRPTWHFVTPEDIRWMLDLSAPRLRAGLASMDRQLGLDKDTLKRSKATLINAFKTGKQLTRNELEIALKKNDINTNGLRSTHLMFHAELDGIICSEKDSALAIAIGNDFKGRISLVLYAAAILLSYVTPLIALVIYAGVAVIWFIPDQRIEKTLRS